MAERKPTRRDRIKRRRRLARQLAGEGFTQRQIAKQLNVSNGTVTNDLAAGRPKPAFANAAGPGNTRSLVHGARSENALAPVRERHVDALKADFPTLDHRRLALLADRLARIELASTWLDQVGEIVRDEEGEVFYVVKELEKWSTRAEIVLKELTEEYKAVGKYQGLAPYMNGDDG